MKNKGLHLFDAKRIAFFILLFVATGEAKLFSQTLFNDGTLNYIVFENTINDEGLVLVTGLADSGQTIKDLVIPNSIQIEGKMYSINWIMPYAFNGCTDLVTVTIPNSITSIGEGTFFNCTSLQLVKFPNTLTSIGSYAFYGCKSITTMALPKSIIIHENAFKGCNNLNK